eukprot:scaffold453_cov170-Skeletonema_menzelii.AAC.1
MAQTLQCVKSELRRIARMRRMAPRLASMDSPTNDGQGEGHSITYHSSFTYCICIKMNTPRSRSRRQVRFSDRSHMCIINNLSPELWYSQEEMDLFGARFCHHVREVRSQLRDYNDLLIEGEGEGEGRGCITINAAAILGLEKHLSPELTAEYSDRRVALQRA